MISEHVVLLSVPALRAADLSRMPSLAALATSGEQAALAPSFPAVTCPVQANMTTGKLPCDHGVIANGFYWRNRQEVEMWTAWNDCIQAPQIWDILRQYQPSVTSAIWFALHSKGAGADYICTPAPIHNPDGSESLWCYTRPEGLYPELVERFDHFPLHHFWGPLANIASSEWIAASAIHAAEKYRPNFFYIYLPHLDYAAQRDGPDSPPALLALGQLDELLGKLFDGMRRAYGPSPLLWLIASEYVITPVRRATFPNRLLREAGLLRVRLEADGERLDFQASDAWALVDHQLAHVFVRDRDPRVTARVVELFRHQPGFAEVLSGDQRGRYDLVHERSGDAILISQTDSWQAYYWWLDDARAPPFARKVDIHNKPGYDPLEMHFDPQTMGISLDTSRVKGSHGAPAHDAAQRGVIIASQRGVLPGGVVADFDVAPLVLRQFGV
jgi:predicted AlkP superfamily pyrophosphatase or phosphodiesterase